MLRTVSYFSRFQFKQSVTSLLNYPKSYSFHQIYSLSKLNLIHGGLTVYWTWLWPFEAWTLNLSVRVGASMDSIAPACFTNDQLDRDVESCMPTRHLELFVPFAGPLLSSFTGTIVLLRRSQLMWDSVEAGPKVLQIGKVCF